MKAPRKKMTKENWTGLAFVAPAFVLLAIFLFVPFFMTVGYSFTNYNILKPDRMEFVGLKNLYPTDSGYSIYEEYCEYICIRNSGSSASGMPGTWPGFNDQP